MKRRQFLKTGLAFAATGVAIKSAFASDQFLMSMTNEHASNDEMRLALEQAWNAEENEKPEVYLHDKNLLSKGADIKSAVIDDLNSENVLSVDGLILSKTEVAFTLFLKSHLS